MTVNDAKMQVLFKVPAAFELGATASYVGEIDRSRPDRIALPPPVMGGSAWVFS